MTYSEIIADNLEKRGCSLGYVSASDSQGRTIWIADAHRDDGKRFVVHADEIADRVSRTGNRRFQGCRNVLTSRRDFSKLAVA